MGTRTTYTYVLDHEGMEDFADQIKSIVLRGLVKDKMLSDTEAEKWAKTHTLVGRHKTFFRTVFNLWSKEEESEGRYWQVVGL